MKNTTLYYLCVVLSFNVIIIFKWRTQPKENIPADLIVNVHENGWMDKSGMKVRVDKVWGRRKGPLLKKKVLLVLDQF